VAAAASLGAWLCRDGKLIGVGLMERLSFDEFRNFLWSNEEALFII